MMNLDPAKTNSWPTAQTPYEEEALAFCRAWLGGQQQFTLYTSGSTGTPKPIELTRAQMQASAQLTGQTLGLQTGDAALVCLNIRYVAGIMMLVRGLELGLPMTIIDPSANPLLDFTPGTDTFAFTALVPLQVQTILDGSPDKLPLLDGMKAILVGGAATSSALEKAIGLIKAPVYATYGMTETVSHIALRRLNGSLASEFFTALQGVQLGTDARGCLHITSVATNFDLIQTNDVVELLPDTGTGNTQFRLLGRADRIINSGGVKVQPEQVEQLIYSVLANRPPNNDTLPPRLFVAGLPDERLGQRVVVICEQVAIDMQRWATAQALIREKLGAYAVPKEIIPVARFLETPTGKIDQKATIAQIA
ncbi:AMP-binding protein [Spirosoma linguale]|uniref:O-succinylbenzoic acid--CoA ligase n=1 Tax=Spirosoma linguale (strain ATCC 33905 / DSM 74 / LMG 10896 / Claus 1) TaxID=504472 RepID=D2QQU3_SPILD|nr:O-succinylbenzoic acid--CoA ligase [Spirosoma linguale DSM 74]